VSRAARTQLATLAPSEDRALAVLRQLPTLTRAAILRQEAQRRADLAAYASDPLAFARAIFPHHFTRHAATFHDELVQVLFGLSTPKGEGVRAEGDPDTSLAPSSFPTTFSALAPPRHVAVAAPRGFAKSTLASFLLPLWGMIFGGRRFIVLVSNTHAQAVKFLQAIKMEWEVNGALRALVPDLRPNLEKWAEDDCEWHIGADRIKIVAVGVGAQLRGLKFLQYRPDCIIIDDGEDDEMVRSETRRADLQWWLDHVVLNTNPRAWVVMVGTILHEASLLNRLVRRLEPADQRRYRTWTTRIYQALLAETSTWPEHQPTEQLLEEREANPYAFAQEKQNEPVPPEYCPFKPEYFRDALWWHHEAELPSALTVSVTLDPACTDREYSDETAIAVAGWDAHGTLWVLDLLHEKYADPSDILDMLFSTYRTWQQRCAHRPGWDFYCVGIEKIAFQKFLINLFQQECRQRNVRPYIQELKGDRDKTRRVWQLEPLFRQNRIRVNGTLLSLEAQLRAFPNGAHDDQADALAYHLALGAVLPRAQDEAIVETGYTFKDYAEASERRRRQRATLLVPTIEAYGPLVGWN